MPYDMDTETTEENAMLEKATALDFATGYAEITKFEKNEDGTAYVYGKATDDTLDLDLQICDPKWLDTAMPRWFKEGGNVREMHGPSAAGVAKEYKAEGVEHFIGVHVVDPVAVMKCETGTYKGFSIGIKSPRVIQDNKALNGRIIDGQIVEISLVDRPANPSAKLVLAKTVEGESSLMQVEEASEEKTEKGSKMEQLNQIVELAKSLTHADVAKFDKTLYDNARRALAELIASEAMEMTEGHDERYSLARLSEAVNALMDWYAGENFEGETSPIVEVAEVGEKSADIEDCADGKCGKCDKCNKGVEVPDTTEMEETDQAHKSAEAEETPAAEETTEDSATEEVAETPAEESADAPAVEEIISEAVEEAVKSAMKSVEAKIAALQAEKESAVTKAVSLEAELEDALNKAVKGGPKRAATDMPENTKNDALVKAAIYKGKMDATTDPLLYKGFSDLRNAELQKAGLLEK